MDKRLEHRLCIALVLFAAALRLASASGLDAQAEQAVALKLCAACYPEEK